MTTHEPSNNSLWASAFVLMALILFASSKHTPRAPADTALTSNGMTMVTTPSSTGTDLLYVIDDYRAVLMIYTLPNPQNESQISPVASWYLPAMFNSIRK